MDALTNAEIIVVAIYNELDMGTKHYRADTNELLEDPIDILDAMRSDNLIFEPTFERAHVFSGGGGTVDDVSQRGRDAPSLNFYRIRHTDIPMKKEMRPRALKTLLSRTEGDVTGSIPCMHQGNNGSTPFPWIR